ncbi:MAG: hypothetical protein ACLQGP_23835 [Isosphaeraceae bacterium]
MFPRLSIMFLAGILWTTSAGAETPSSLTERFLVEGKLAEGEKILSEMVAARPNDGEALFGLGAIQFIRASEHLVQSFHRYGMQNSEFANALPFERLPIPANKSPEVIRYADRRAIMKDFNDDLIKAESTLARIVDKDVKLPLHFGQIRLDINHDGKAEEDETLWKIYAQLNSAARGQVTAEASKAFLITFDRGDVAWLRGYCHLLMAMCEAILAHDFHEMFDYSGCLFYPKAETSFPFLLRGGEQRPLEFSFENIVDAVAMIHMMRLPVSEPERMRAALAHLESMIALSRESWAFILAETDDDHEWVPNPKQHTVVPGGAVSDAMVKGWMEFLDEAQAIFKGEKLIPFWRRREDRGVNLRRVFTEPRMFDLLLWVQGTAAAPYLEKGPKTKPETWRRLQTIFQGQFIGFAFWFN